MIATATQLLNFVLVGETRSGAGMLATGINTRPEANCHIGLFHDNAEVRRFHHERYFGPSDPDAIVRPWFVEGETNPWHYINNTVLDNPQGDETAIGFHMTYPVIRKWELFELFQHRCNEGDFCVIHVVRNPVACFVSLKQAQKTGLWALREDRKKPNLTVPSAIRLDENELTAFCRDHAAMRQRIRSTCNDVLEIPYTDVVDVQATMRRVFHFLELDELPELVRPAIRRLPNRTIEQRIANFSELRCLVPSDVRREMDAEDLF